MPQTPGEHELDVISSPTDVALSQIKNIVTNTQATVDRIPTAQITQSDFNALMQGTTETVKDAYKTSMDEGSGLTQDDRNKLHSLTNYDDANIHQKLDAIQSKTDQLSFTDGLVQSVAQTVLDKQGYQLTQTAMQDIASSVELALVDETDGVALIQRLVDAIGNEDITASVIAQAVWEYEQRVLTTTSGLTDEERAMLEDIKNKGGGGSRYGGF